MVSLNLKEKKKANPPQRKIFFLTLIFSLIGLVSIADASSPLAQKEFSDKFFFVKQQAIWLVIGMFSLLLFSRVNYLFWKKIATYLFIFNLILLVLVFIPGVGAKFLGAKRWIVLGVFSFQPSEILKLSLVAYLAKLCTQNKKTFIYFIPIVVSAILIMLQPDLGTTLIIVGTGLIQLLVSGISLKAFSSSIVLGMLALLVSVLTSSYRRERLISFLKLMEDPLKSSYHIRQILFALGSGGLLGVGLGQSRQKYLFLPETATDSIFAVIAEEIGFIGASFLILLFIYYIHNISEVVVKAPDSFSRIFSAGIMSIISLQIILNVGSIVSIFPLTGVPLPFISYGGSSLVTLLTGCGVLLNISRYAKEK